MQAKKDTQKKLLFKFVDEESDDYFKRSDEKELQYDGGSDDDKNKKMAMIVAGVVIVGLLVGFFALRGGDDTTDAAVDDALSTPDGGGFDDDEDADTPNICYGSGAAPVGTACTLEEQGYTQNADASEITDPDTETPQETEATATFCTNNEGEWAEDPWCVIALAPEPAEDTFTSTLATPSSAPVNDLCAGIDGAEAEPGNGSACTLAEQGYVVSDDGLTITDAAGASEDTAFFCRANEDDQTVAGDAFCIADGVDPATATPDSI